MPAVRRSHSTTRHRDRRSNDPKYDERIQSTIDAVLMGHYKSFRAASKETRVRVFQFLHGLITHFFQIPLSTLTDRAKGRHRSWRDVSAKRQLLSPEQEAALVDWCILRGSMGEPWSAAELCNEATAISGKEVGNQWHRSFEKRHPEIQSAKTSKLNPKRAKHFNETIIGEYFDLWEELDAKYGGIPPEHIYNMDEKGIQMGGGRKKSSKKFYFLKSQKHRYRIRSDNLELVTILECISASGEVVPPAFCLQNGAAPDLRDELCDDEWSRFGLGLLSCMC